MPRRPPFALLLAGSDPSGGAGLEIGLKVHALFGVHAAAIATCTTLQTALGVARVTPTDCAAATRQFEALAATTPWQVVQVGMVADAAWLERLAEWAKRSAGVPWVVDPVVAPTRGPRTLPRALLGRYRRHVIPCATLLTPNAVEAAELLGWQQARIERDVEAALTALLELGAKAVLLKGGHLRGDGPVVDRLRGPFGSRDFVHRRARNEAPRGTGCALAAAIAACVACGLPLPTAVARAERWLATARRAARPIGKGRPYLGLPRPEPPPRAV